ncbi:hypothetical protein Hypma_006247 [Hypsizygus marmoreus]|uniref:F-box domain-containing protein n=1 Tax=Hypsizygus marmoreus TaxID=39966 RepID=A0A369JV53_HYPMA|nr:hypothetical protein Hypma_006247 [Hypsizygus marmoreus]
MLVHQCLDIFRLSTHLDSATFANVVPSEWVMEHSPNRFDTSLSYLRLSSTADISLILESVEFRPSLKHLEVHVDEVAGNFIPPARWNVVWPSVETLILHYYMRINDAFELFSCCTNVSKLTWLWDSIVQVPITKLPDVVLLDVPHLNELTVTPNLAPKELKTLVDALDLSIQRVSKAILPSMPVVLMDSQSAITAHSSLHQLHTLTLTCPITLRQCLCALANLPMIEKLDLDLHDSLVMKTLAHDGWQEIGHGEQGGVGEKEASNDGQQEAGYGERQERNGPEDNADHKEQDVADYEAHNSGDDAVNGEPQETTNELGEIISNDNGRIYLGHLRVIRLRSSIDLTVLFRSLLIPKVDALHLTFRRQNGHNIQFFELASLLRRSRCDRPPKLEIYNAEISGEELDALECLVEKVELRNNQNSSLLLSGLNA